MIALSKLLRCWRVASRVIQTLYRALRAHARDPMTTPPVTSSSDSRGAQKTLSASSVGALRLWLQSQRTAARSGRPLHHDNVRRAMSLVCSEVRRRGLPVERLIILLKEQWFTLTDDGDGGNTRSREALEQIIRTCIDEFYASAASFSSPSRVNGPVDLSH